MRRQPRHETNPLVRVDQLLASQRETHCPAPPATGWINTVRKALDMTAAALGRRTGMTGEGVRKLEKAEASDAITLGTLRKMADALGCDVRYVLVPRQALQQLVVDQARELARQQLSPDAENFEVDILASKLLAGPRRDFW